MIQVTSEVGRLRKVLVHEPGAEVDLMVPAMMDELLFDDILFGDLAREEHGQLRRLLQVLGVEVVEAERLLEEALEVPAARAWLAQMLLPECDLGMRRELEAASASQLVSLAVCGRRQAPQGAVGSDLYSVTPLVNWCFQRDPQVVAYDGVIFSAMATPARWREALLSRVIFQFHPSLAGTKVLLDPLQSDAQPPLLLGPQRPRLEGGDVLVLSPDVMAIGISERTNRAALSVLARALSRREGGPRWLVVVHLPSRRAYMHLDTVFTPIDRDAALVHAPILDGQDRAQIYEVDLHSPEPTPVAADGLFETLRRRGVDLQPLFCGGDDPVAQQREQWTDGANALALAPGVVVLYDRNVRTAQVLADQGYDVLAGEDLLLGRHELQLERCGKTCLLLSSNEISRARGGPHCLTHPLVREP